MDRKPFITLVIFVLLFALHVAALHIADFFRSPDSFSVGGLQAQTVKKKPHALPTGTHIVPPVGVDGLCELTVDNTNKDVDAVVKLVREYDKVLTRFFYIQRGRQTTITDIEPGRYICYAHTGLDWNPIELEFNRDGVYSKFDRLLMFQQIETEDSIQYSSIKITLYRVRHGNATTSGVSKKEFDRAGKK